MRAGLACAAHCRPGWGSAWRSSAACWAACKPNWRPPPPSWKRPPRPVVPKDWGGITYQTIEGEIGDWHRFSNRRQVGSYTGLCGGVSASGRSRHLLSITKHGNVRLRTALIELAWRLVLWQPESKLIKKWWPVVGTKKTTKAARKKAIVAIARQMAVDLWRWRTGRVKPEDLGWVMVGPEA